ncbi:dynamin family protein [Burkholderia vietnamiensis]|uniref:dynamin family protein n=1 Tax=Burkholderia vietnamiensis TaxID=60552 RepID=UPI00264B5D73|nr:dynamin family protein [Burkholderia vietnamiensis]MDN7926893.1 dynamin family protein [Burkholderia vietnamiensis]
MARDDKHGAFPPAYTQRIADAFSRVDACVSDALHYLDPLSRASPFPARIADGIPVQYQRLVAELDQLRTVMRTIADRHRISPSAPTASAVACCRLRISEAMVAISQLDPRIETGIPAPAADPLSDDLEDDACRLVDHMMQLLSVLLSALTDDADDAAPHAPAAADDAHAPQSTAPPDDRDPLLRELERVTVSHGLGDLHRRTLDFARHHACADAVVGLFGAVSTGKSSLVNSLLGDALLPVAALPTTAVPVEIRHGATTRGWVAFATEQPEAIDRARVAEFVDAHFNADNYRGVTRIALQSPSTLLAKGVTLIDTPGLDGETSDALLANAWTLPWCDIAILLISASAPLTLREATLVRELSGRGARVIVLVTKIDLIDTDDRWRIYDHVVSGLWRSTNLEVPVYLVSIREEDPPWRRAWVDGPLADALAQCREQRAAQRLRQLGTLRRDILDALQIRLLWQSPYAQSDSRIGEAIDELTASRNLIAVAIDSIDNARPRLGLTMAALLAEIAHNAAALWSETHDASFDATRLIELAAQAHARSLAGATMRTVESLHACADIALHRAAETLGLPRLLPTIQVPCAAPAFTWERALPTTLFPRAMGRWFGRRGFQWSVRKLLPESAAVQIVQRSLAAHLDVLSDWKRSELAALVNTLDEQIARLQRVRNGSDIPARSTAEQLRDDISRLRSFEVDGTPGDRAST